MATISSLLFSGRVAELESALKTNSELANQEVELPDNPATAHPLHRICDAVFGETISEERGLELAKIFIKYGAQVNIQKPPGKDSPLTAACSLHCDKIALLYVDNGADINHQGCHGGTALHWAAWCGRDIIVNKLVQMVTDINQLCIDFKSTPLFWAIHGHRFGGDDNRYNQFECARLLLTNGADPNIPNFEGYTPAQLVEPGNLEMIRLFQQGS
jgi:uncharacterized protein